MDSVKRSLDISPKNADSSSVVISRAVAKYFFSVLVKENFLVQANNGGEAIRIGFKTKDLAMTSKNNVFKNIDKAIPKSEFSNLGIAFSIKNQPNKNPPVTVERIFDLDP